jgi:hypothetical protein
VSQYLGGGETLVSALLDIDGLRDFRVRAQWQNLIKDMRVEEYKTIYDARHGSWRHLSEEPVHGRARLWAEADQLELVKHQINKMVDWGRVYPRRRDWEPYVVKQEIAERIRRAGSL